MEFETEAQRACYEELAGRMPESMAEMSYWADPDRPLFRVVSQAGIPLTLEVRPISTDSAFVQVSCPLARGVQSSIEVTEALLQERAQPYTTSESPDGDPTLIP